MTKYREILRLRSLGFSQNDIAASCQVSKKTVNRVLKLASEHNLRWPLEERLTDKEIDKIIHPNGNEVRKNSDRKIPDFDHVKKKLLRNGMNKKLLWAEYLEECRLENAKPLMYSQFCHYILQDERVRRATMHVNRKPGEQIEVDWAGDPAYVIDPETGEQKKAYVFVDVLNYSMYAYAEAFPDEKQKSWNDAHIHMFEFFGGVSKMLVPDNCKTAVTHNRRYEDELNSSYQELAEYYGIAIVPARVRTPKNKASAEGAPFLPEGLLPNTGLVALLSRNNQTLIEMYLAGVSVRRVEDVTELLWGSRVSASTVSNLNQKVYGKIEECWLNAPLFLQKNLTLPLV